MNKFFVLAALVAYAYAVPIPQAESDREGRDLLFVQQFPTSAILPEALPVQQDPGFITPAFSSSPFSVAFFFPGFPSVSSSSNATNYYISDPAAPYAYPYYAQPAQPYPIFRRFPAAQPHYVFPVAPVQEAASDASGPQTDVAAPADAVPSAAAEQEVQGRFFTVQVPSDLSSFSITKPSLVNWANTGTTSGLSISGVSGLSTTNTAAVLASLGGSSGISVGNNGNLYVTGK